MTRIPKKRKEGLYVLEYLAFLAVTPVVFFLCVCVGSVKVPLGDTVRLILDAIRADGQAWKNFLSFSEPYKRIRVAYIDAARRRRAEFEKRLAAFIKKTRENKLITGYGGIDKYYGENE